MLQSIKKMVKKLLPASWYHVDYRINEFNKRITNVDKNIIDVNKNIADVDKNITNVRKQGNNVEQRILNIERNLSEINVYLQKSLHAGNECCRKITEFGNHIPKKVLYNNDFERKVIQSFYDINVNSDFKEKFMALVKGLDPESIETVVRILKRQQTIKNTEGQDLDIWTREEQERILSLKEDFEAERFKVADDLYCYKNYFLPINHFEASVFFDKHGLTLVDNIEYLKDKDIIDAGAYIGDSILIFAPLTKQKVYSFEAVKENYDLMLKTIEINGIKNAVPEKLALGSRKGTITINYSGSSSSVTEHLVAKTLYKEEVRVITLDEYVDEHKLKVGLIKVDIEGFEQELLKGAEKTIKEQKPILLLSIYHNADDFFSIKPKIESWDLGYKFIIHKPKDYTLSREVLLICQIE